ncbi:protein kinase domain-containing protein [Streptomyces sp. E-08]|uniref:class III lanthionine synthetase LanKC N-terminal domain-containing protein n=1 Tax=Streptomyces sp. E-08 TaxID=3404047 RepID=UPI003CF92CBB
MDTYSDFNEAWSRRALSPLYRENLAQLLPAGWTIHRHDIWLHANREESSWPNGQAHEITQGFKIHVSSALDTALQVMKIVIPECVKRGIEFKVVGDPQLHIMLDGKRQTRAASGKFMTIYPLETEAMRELLEVLYRLTRDEPLAGPHILSDRRYRDSRILSYRYGGFYPPQRVRIDGTHETLLVSPDGEYVSDERVPYFRLPPWAVDPFGAGPLTRSGEQIALKDRYLVESAHGFSNAGGTYYGTDTVTGAPVFIKEARPLTNCWVRDGRSWDSTNILRHEFDVLEKLHPLPWVPAPVDCFEDAEHTFMVQERVTGMNVRQFWARNDVILSPYIRVPGRLENWVPIFRTVAEKLISMVIEVHGQGVLLGDLSPDNVLIDPETHDMWLVDFESAVMDEDDLDQHARGVLWGTPGFMRPKRTEGQHLAPEDDFYAAGMILYGALCPVNQLFDLNPSAREVFLDGFISLGLPHAVRTTIDSALAGDSKKALESLESLSVP